jgi:hypothetical protein
VVLWTKRSQQLGSGCARIRAPARTRPAHGFSVPRSVPVVVPTFGTVRVPRHPARHFAYVSSIRHADPCAPHIGLARTLQQWPTTLIMPHRQPVRALFDCPPPRPAMRHTGCSRATFCLDADEPSYKHKGGSKAALVCKVRPQSITLRPSPTSRACVGELGCFAPRVQLLSPTR